MRVFDPKHIILSLAQRNPLNSQIIFRQIRYRSETLATMPLRGRIIPELFAIGIDGYRRELVIHPYRLLYRIVERSIFVLGLFDSRRDLEEVLFERLMY